MVFLRFPILFVFAVLTGLLYYGCARPLPPASPLTYNPIDRYRFRCEPIDSVYVADHLDALETLFGANLHADAYRAKLLAALAFYPDLRDVEIHLRHRRLRTSMAARPLRLGAGPGRRRYAIYVDDITDKPNDFRNSIYAAQVGCFIHELGHIAHYEQQANDQLVTQGLAYVTNQKFKNRYERIADNNVLRVGGGYQLYLYRRFTFERAELPEDYLAFKRRNYRSQDRILELHLEYVEEIGVKACRGYGSPNAG